MIRTLWVVLPLLPALACSTPGPDGPSVSAVQAAIEAQNLVFMEAFAAKDIDRLVGLFTEDAVVLPPNSGPHAGLRVRDAMAADVSAIASLTLETLDVEVLSPQAAVERGEYVAVLEPQESGELIEDRGSYVVFWRRGEDGQWRLHWDIWNTDLPAE